MSPRQTFDAKKWIEAVDRTRNAPLLDSFLRQHTYLRLSLTEKCLYCMPENGISLTPKQNLLTRNELFRISSLFVSRGVDKIRLTGGEPTLRKDLVDIVRDIDTLKSSGLKKISMTTNGIILLRNLDTLIKNGLDNVNISLDTLNPDLFTVLTRRKGFEQVLDSIKVASSSNISVKVNCVVMRGINENEIMDFVDLAASLPITVRFIEYMPFDGNAWSNKKLVPFTEMLDQIKKHYTVMRADDDMHSTTKTFKIPGQKGNIGFITSMTDHFCGGCNRLRITADGKLKVCLFGSAEISLRDIIRKGGNELDLNEAINLALKEKKYAHAGMKSPTDISKQKNRPMILIGAMKRIAACRYSSSKSGTNSSSSQLTHIDVEGNMRIVDVGKKKDTERIAIAEAIVELGPAPFRAVLSQIEGESSSLSKGNVLNTAQIAGIMGMKNTSQMIPLCHPLLLNHAKITFELMHEKHSILIQSQCQCLGKTGVEMEALTGATLAALTIYDMCKAMSKDIVIRHVRLLEKSGGNSGTYSRQQQ